MPVTVIANLTGFPAALTREQTHTRFRPPGMLKRGLGSALWKYKETP